MDDRNWGAPIPLPAYQPVPDFIIYFLLSFTLFSQFCHNLFTGLLRQHAIILPRVNHLALSYVAALECFWLLNHFGYRQAELLGKFIVALIMRRHCHNGTRAVSR